MIPTAGAAGTTLAHGGGIPEIATAVVPLIVLGAVLYAGRRRERAEREREQADASGEQQGDDLSS